MKNAYEKCPVFENESFLLREVKKSDCADLHKVYSDEKAVPFFNSDNCHGDTFHYMTIERMEEAINFWIYSYKNKYFVRWAIVDKISNEAIGTIELFNRQSKDGFNNCGILRLDLRSDYENSDAIVSVLSLILKPSYSLFNYQKVASKAISSAHERIAAFKELGFEPTSEKLIGHDGTAYSDYYVQALI